MTPTSKEGGPRTPTWLRALLVLTLIYLFLVAITMLGGAFKSLGKDSAERLISHISNPFSALAVGILATVLVQSSSVTTSSVVSAVAGLMAASAGAGAAAAASHDELVRFIGPFVPMIMGANIGTTITNTLVSMGHVTRSAEFRRAFAGATMHDFFNITTVAVLLPIEIATRFLTRLAVWLVQTLRLGGGVEYDSPIKSAVKAGYTAIKDSLHALTGLESSSTLFLILTVVLAVAMIFICLVYITRLMTSILAGRLEVAINRALERSGLLGIAVGILLTVAVQSSSITTSLLVPMFGAGLLSLENGFPICLGANIGTTVTALLAAVAAGPAGLAIALVHLLFNLTGILLIYPIPAVRNLPIRCARLLADRASRVKWWILIYVGGVFVVLPLLGMLIFDRG